ncbi:MAG: DUF2147 domain-containing protein [Rhodoplanes sp.]|uniref:DUF2147 domain-containing protein n=1 Tax=Rhodoplanes sp. TaxID=1968906 RepID=UPI00185B3DBD|nr:DUF2147 domain-containing protein [Rhodoplanes sp.]NVO16442.1 DUF2147 domain-containing protein [Rhodoplanes sp.]
MTGSRTLGFAAAIVLLSSVAHAGSISIPVNGGTVRVDIDESCRNKLCGTVSWREHGARDAQQFDLPAIGWKDIKGLAKGDLGKLGGFGKTDDEPDAPAVTTDVPAPQWRSRPGTTAAPTVQPTPTPTTSVAVPPPPPAPPPVVDRTDPAPVTAPTTYAPPPPPAPVAAPVAAPAPEQRVAALPPAPAPVAEPATGPLGLWMTEKKEGMVRVEPCGQNLCGYAVDAKTGRNGDKVLIDMKASGKTWTGRIKDTRNGGGGIYDSTLAMKGDNAMRVQGCAFGGMFCGGQTWTRVVN